MAGALDTALKNAAKAVVADLGSSLDTTITYTRKASPTYNTSTGALSTTDTAYSNIKVPIEFILSDEEGQQEIYDKFISDLSEITLSYTMFIRDN